MELSSRSEGRRLGLRLISDAYLWYDGRVDCDSAVRPGEMLEVGDNSFKYYLPCRAQNCRNIIICAICTAETDARDAQTKDWLPENMRT